MRLLIALLILCAAFAPARADQSDVRLDRLFQQLLKATTPPEAKSVEREIVSLWLRSGSDTADVLMTRAQQAFEAQDLPTAKKLLDAVTEMRPRYAEVWYRRAELLVAMNNLPEAEHDLQTAIQLEPRHFLALVLAGRLQEQGGQKQAALATYRQAIVINPQLEAIKRKVGALAAELEGKDI